MRRTDPPSTRQPLSQGLGFALQLMLLVLLPLAVVAVVIPLGSLALHAQAMRALVAERDRRAVQAAAASLRQQLEHQATAIQGLALHAGSAPAPEGALFVTTGPPTRLPPEREIAAYRFAQEALSNIARHSQATQAEVAAAFEPSAFRLHIRDNGRGFAPPERLGDLAADSHFGLVGMHERAELVAGRVTLRAAPGQGTTVELRLPLG